jgi:ankyrin repeat protein
MSWNNEEYLPEIPKNASKNSPKNTPKNDTELIKLIQELNIVTLESKKKEIDNTITRLLTEGKNINGKDLDINAKGKYGMTALMYVSSDSRSIFKLLLDKGAEVNAIDDTGKTACIHAAIKGDRIKLAGLLEYKANINVKDNSYMTALMHSLKNNNNTYNYIFNNGGEYVDTDISDKTVLMYACLSKDKDIDKFIITLINKGVDINAKDFKYMTALMYILNEEYKPNIVRLFLEKGADVNATDIYENTALIKAITIPNIDIDIIKLILKKGADVNAKDNEGKTALMYASIRDDYDVDTKIETKNTGIVKLLLENGAKINDVDKTGKTALMNGILHGHNREVVFYLITHRADLNIVDGDKTTALMYAVIKNDYDIVESLLLNGADLTIYDHDNKTAFMMASEYNFIDIVNLIERYKERLINIDDISDSINQSEITPEIKLLKINNIQENKIRQREHSIIPTDNRESLSYLERELVRNYTANSMSIKMLVIGDNTFNATKVPIDSLLSSIMKKYPQADDEEYQLYLKRVYYYIFVNLYNVIQKAPKINPPEYFRVWRGSEEHYLIDDTSRFNYINLFTSTTYSLKVSDNFGKIKYLFYIHPMCNYMNVKSVSAYPDEDEVVLTPYYRYIYINKIDTDISKYTIYVYAILPTDLVIPKLYSEFFEWNKKLRTGQSGGKNLLSLKHNIVRKKLNRTNNNKRLKLRSMNNTKKRNKTKPNKPMTNPNTNRFTDPLPSVRGKEPTKEEREVIEHMKQSVMKLIESKGI